MRTNFSIAYDDLIHLFIIDCSNEEPGYASITNAAQEVVSMLNLEGRRLYYQDTDGNIDEIIHSNGKLYGIAPAPAKIRAKLLPYAR